MRTTFTAVVALLSGLAAGYLLGVSPHARHATPHHDTITVTFPDPHHPDGRALHTLEVVGVFPVDTPDVRTVRPDDWVIRHFDAGDPQGGTITYARVVTQTP